jgi:TRAP-type C4-dicarboxylate transport system substrate-binding protein
VRGLKLAEVTSYHVHYPLGTSVGMIFMGRKKYNSLPAQARAALDATTGEVESRKIGEYYDVEADAVRATVAADPKQTIVTLNAAQAAAWKQKIDPFLNAWAATRPDGTKVLSTFREKIAQASD